MAPLSSLVSLLPFLRRDASPNPSAAAFPPYITINTEPSSACRTLPDQLGDVPWSFGGNVQLNVTCWTESSISNDKKGHPYDDGSFTWLWVRMSDSTREPYGSPGIGNADQGGKAGGLGCWMHEDHIKNGSDLYFPDEVDWCGTAPHHQVGVHTPYNTPFVCRNCTDLADPACQTTYNTTDYGYSALGCWKEGTAVNGNSTWIQYLEPPAVNCWISPDQFDPKEWHGPPAGKCK